MAIIPSKQYFLDFVDTPSLPSSKFVENVADETSMAVSLSFDRTDAERIRARWYVLDLKTKQFRKGSWIFLNSQTHKDILYEYDTFG